MPRPTQAMLAEALLRKGAGRETATDRRVLSGYTEAEQRSAYAKMQAEYLRRKNR